MSPDAVRDVLRRSGAPPGWIGAIIDAEGNVIARSSSDEDVGQIAGQAVRNAVTRAPSGFYQSRTQGDVEIETLDRTLPGPSGWSVHFGGPTEAVNAPVSTSHGILIAGGVTSLRHALLLADLISRDVAQRRKQEEERAAAALAASEARRIIAVEAAQLGTWHWDHSKDLISGSERTRALLGLPIGNRAGHGLQWSYDLVVSVVDPAHRASFQHALLQCRENNQPIDVEFSVVHPDGATRWVRLCGLAPSFAEANIAGGTDAALIHGVIVPIHARKRAEAERRDLLRRLSEAQENEQRHIARELHDQVGQTVTGLSLGLKRLEQKPAGIPPDEGTHMR
jgi:signal transduction histidine kinase